MRTIRTRALAGIVVLVTAGLFASCGTGGPGNSTHQPNSCVGAPGGPCTPSERK